MCTTPTPPPTQHASSPLRISLPPFLYDGLPSPLPPSSVFRNIYNLYGDHCGFQGLVPGPESTCRLLAPAGSEAVIQTLGCVGTFDVCAHLAPKNLTVWPQQPHQSMGSSCSSLHLSCTVLFSRSIASSVQRSIMPAKYECQKCLVFGQKTKQVQFIDFICMCTNLYTYICMYVYLYVSFVCSWECIYECGWVWKPAVSLRCGSSATVHSGFLAWSLLIRLDWLASEFCGVACLFLPSTVIISTYKHNCMLLSLAF